MTFGLFFVASFTKATSSDTNNLLWYAFVKDRMADTLREGLYISRNFVMGSSDSSKHVNMHLDEGNESGIIRDVKINVKTCDATFIQNAP